MSLFREFAEELGIEVHMDRLFEILYNKALNGDADCGGLFKTKGVGQGILAAAINAPVSVMETAGESGPWGMALLASYMLQREPEEGYYEQ